MRIWDNLILINKYAKNFEMNSDLIKLICCPYCKSELSGEQSGLKCTNNKCSHNKEGHYFKSLDGKPILISYSHCDTLLKPDNIKSSVDRTKDNIIKKQLNDLLNGRPKITNKNCGKFIELLMNQKKYPRCLIIGSAEMGRGTENLFTSNLEIIGTDVYLSKSVDIVSDAHYLPFNDGEFQGVWIQAVLEHVVDPQTVVKEIHRVLEKNGIVYSETPFMQQVHEGAYDFTRYTVLGHRYLFKNFSTISIGGDKGAGVVMTWSFKYFLWALLRNKRIASILSIPFAVIFRILEKICDKRSLFDLSSGVYFLGKKSDKTLLHRDLIGIYDGMQK